MFSILLSSTHVSTMDPIGKIYKYNTIENLIELYFCRQIGPKILENNK